MGEAVSVSWGPELSMIVPLQPGYLDEKTLMGVTRIDGPGEVVVKVIPRGFAGP